MELLPTGIEGLDEALRGGVPKGAMTLVHGLPGSGKTTLALQFLREGADQGERCLMITLSEREDSLRHKAASHGWTLDDIVVGELVPVQHAIQPGTDQQVVFNRRDIELDELVRSIVAMVEEAQPSRVVLDALSHLRILADDPALHLRQLIALRDFFARRGVTVLAAESDGGQHGSTALEVLCDGVISLRQEPTLYGNERRSLRILKLRGHEYHLGIHDFVIDQRGIHVFPRLQPAEKFDHGSRETLRSGVPALDALLGGGLKEGTSALLLGPSGSGKTSLSTLFVRAAAERGEASSVFLFDELESTYLLRARSLRMNVGSHVESGRIVLRHVGAGELPMGQLVELVRRDVVERNVKVVVIDTLTGYLASMPDERLLVTQLHELLTFLSRSGVLSIVVVAQHGVVGPHLEAPLDVSYLADAVLLLRHFEAGGELRQAISVFKKRYGGHERRIREIRLSEERGFEVGEPIAAFQGILAGAPVFHGAASELIGRKEGRGD